VMGRRVPVDGCGLDGFCYFEGWVGHFGRAVWLGCGGEDVGNGVVHADSGDVIGGLVHEALRYM